MRGGGGGIQHSGWSRFAESLGWEGMKATGRLSVSGISAIFQTISLVHCGSWNPAMLYPSKPEIQQHMVHNRQVCPTRGR